MGIPARWVVVYALSRTSIAYRIGALLWMTLPHPQITITSDAAPPPADWPVTSCPLAGNIFYLLDISRSRHQRKAGAAHGQRIGSGAGSNE
jgi:hypothetical protein